jgi:hypothetical protein
LMVSDFGYAFRGNGDPIHLLRAPFRCGDSSSGRLGTICPVAALVSTLVFSLFFRGCPAWFVARRVLQLRDSNPRFPSQLSNSSIPLTCLSWPLAKRVRPQSKLPNPSQLALAGARQLRTTDYFLSFSPEV